MSEMIPLKSKTFYYFYLKDEEYYISEEGPTMDDEKCGWFFGDYKCVGCHIYIGDPKSSGNIQEFVDYKGVVINGTS